LPSWPFSSPIVTKLAAFQGGWPENFILPFDPCWPHLKLVGFSKFVWPFYAENVKYHYSISFGNTFANITIPIFPATHLYTFAKYLW